MAASKPACTLVASKLEDAIESKFIKGWASWTSEERVKKLRSAFKKQACPHIGKLQVAMMGEEGKRKYGDFNALMKKGGTMTNLNMGPEQAQAVQGLCDVVVKGETARLVARMEAALQTKTKGKKRRLADFKMREEVCRGLLGTCEEEEEEAAGGGDDDDDDDDKEL